MTTKTKERPIIFSGQMVKAILEGRKTMTRRVVKLPRGCSWYDELGGEQEGWWVDESHPEGWWSVDELSCPYGAPGDRLWIKTGYETRYDAERDQTFWTIPGVGFFTTHGQALSKSVKPKKDGRHPGMFMPEWLSLELRLPLLEVTEVRVERLQEITEADAMDEGAPCVFNPDYDDDDPGDDFEFSHVSGFVDLWDHINGKKHPWASNPFVWVVSFTPTGPSGD